MEIKYPNYWDVGYEADRYCENCQHVLSESEEEVCEDCNMEEREV